MNGNELAQWYYLIYLIPGGTALFLLMASSAGGGRHHKGGGARHHSGGGPRASHSGARHGGGPKHQGAKASAKGGAKVVNSQPTIGEQVLGFFGVGRVPGPFVWGSLLLGWGLFGFWGTQYFEEKLHNPALFALPALAVACTGALVTAKITGEAGARLMPQTESFATDTIDLCGQIGTAAFPVDETRGRVHVYDAHGTMHDCTARIAPGHSPLARGSRVLVVDYDEKKGQLVVEEAP
ncbi:hypothetical protein CCAX7_31620 [Capsulimonas corticalis]|uniref:Uncharacterized protein n=1 Tax=Capsulimonas corticalis TaxID=2219043 RepID=A0A402CSE2_9BACT|nr:OB-fold-containig protein [Capsulimonas corticalis]BDI31111.1 hypothetical protein CCAX7_31620 [Capsulimonas corticalis]